MQRGSRKNRLLDFWIGIPALNIVATFRRKRQLRFRVERLGVMCSPALGDTLLFSGALKDLRSALPEAQITHICMAQNLAAAEIIPGADGRVVIALTKPWATIRQLRRCRFDVLLDFTSWQRLTAFCTLLSGARFTVGFHTPGQHRSRGYDRTVEHRSDRHETANFRTLLLASELVLASTAAHPPEIAVEGIENQSFAGRFQTVALHPWASGQRCHLREWPEDRWVMLARGLARDETLFVVTGAPSDLARMEPFVARLRSAGLRAEAFVSPDGFRSLTSVLRRCWLVVTVNTGVMHLAAIAGARTVAINGPNCNLRWGPIGPCAVGVEAPGEDCGFLHLGFNFDGNPVDCMERTSVEMVLAACHSLLAATATGAAKGQRSSVPSFTEVS